MTNSQPTNWRVQMFGGLQVTGEPGAVVVRHFRTRRAALLLAFLAMKPGAVKARGQLCEMLWPEEDPLVQRNRLRFELSTLRSSLSAAFFASDCGNTTVALASTVTSDVAEFDTLLDRCTRIHAADQRITLMRQAIALYRGDLLPDLDLPDGSPPEFDWLSLERHRLQEVASNAATTLLADLHVLGLHNEATRLSQEMSVLFPYLYELPDEADGLSDRSTKPMQPGASQQVVAYTASPPVLLLQGSFLGRENELCTLRCWARGAPPPAGGKPGPAGRDGGDSPALPRLQPSHRLVTILGPGGVGKTRLLIEGLAGYAYTILVPLSGASNKGEIYEAIALVLALPRRPNLPLRQQVLQALRARPDCLLLLDNCEHIVEDCAACVSELLQGCPHLRIGATSQRALMLEGEQALSLVPLPSHDARRLFLNRARAVLPTFASRPAAVVVAEEVADLIGGFPLALELAAARAIILEPHQMRDQLRQQLNFLTSAHPARPVRHRSMRAVLQWSVGLLSEGARRTLTFLALFRTSASLEAIQAVLGGDASVVDGLEELRLYSLLIVRFADPADATGKTRYDVLSHVRAFATELLTDQDRYAGWERHADFWTQQVASIPQAFHWGQWETIRNLLVPDIENIRGAIEGCIQRGLAPILYRLTNALGTAFLEMGYWDDTELLLDRVEETGQLSSKQIVRLLGLRGALDRRRGNEENACKAWERSLALVRQSTEQDLKASILFDLAGQAIDLNQFSRALTLIEEGMAVAQQEALEFRRIVGGVLMARLCVAQEQLTEAAVWAETSWIALPETQTSASQYLYVLVSLLPVFRACNNTARVAELIRRGVPLVLETGHAYNLARLLDDAALFWEAHGVPDAAELGLFIAYRIHEELGSRFQESSRTAWDNWNIRKRRSHEETGAERSEKEMEFRAGRSAPSWQEAVKNLRLIPL